MHRLARDSLDVVLGLGLTPAVAWATSVLAPSVQVSEQLSSALAFAGGALLPVCGLALAARANLPLRVQVIVALLTGSTLFALALAPTAPLPAMLLADAALVSLGWAFGVALGRRVQHASHLLPACFVVACADTASLLSPEGPTHAIAGSEHALSVVATWFPVFGTRSFAPALGLGDLLFCGLVFGVAAKHRLPYARTVALALAGTIVAGCASAVLAAAVPALVPIAAAIALGLPVLRRVRPADRKATTWSIALAGAVLAAVLARRLLAG